jgi:SAM-dependent methyltransferase
VLERVIDGLRLPARARILDAGCGSGRNMLELARHGTVAGVELSATSAALARARGVGEVIEGSVLEMPFEAASFDLAVSLDVIEHLGDDLAALRELRRVVAPGGALLVTVPAYQWLWSGHDEINHHHRRYTRRSLQRVAEEAGWETVRTTYFNSLLLPVAIVLRVLDRFSRATTESSLDLWVPPEPLNWLLERPLALEAAIIARGGRIPAGLSLLTLFRYPPLTRARTRARTTPVKTLTITTGQTAPGKSHQEPPALPRPAGQGETGRAGRDGAGRARLGGAGTGRRYKSKARPSPARGCARGTSRRGWPRT